MPWIVHDAEIYGGNSGGPLVNLQGEIVGINEITFALAGAIPGNLAREVAEKIIREGRAVRSRTSLLVQPLLKASPVQRGALISGAIEGSAGKADFLSGDFWFVLTKKRSQYDFQKTFLYLIL